MKRVALMTLSLVLTLALTIGMVAPGLAYVQQIIKINKTIPAEGPFESFTFELYQDVNENHVIDGGDIYVDSVVIDTTLGSPPYFYSIRVEELGWYVIREILQGGSAYQQPPDQAVDATKSCGAINAYFKNELGELGQLEILKVDEDGAALYGATFVITPDPKTGADSMTLVDNGLNDEDMTVGTLLVTGCIIGLEVTVAETVAPPGYVPAPPQTVTISATVTLTFENYPERGQLEILKVDEGGAALVGATFVITPDPKTGSGSMTVVDNGLNDEDSTDGVLLVTGCIIGLEVTVAETVAPPGYVPAPPQTVTISATVTLTFENYPERGELIIRKVDENGDALVGATFVITPDPQTGSGSLTVVDNGLNDEDMTDGVLLVTGCIIGLTCTVAETVPPPGYGLAPPQTVTISATVTVDFQNFPEDGDATRTPGFWMTHCDFTQHVFDVHLGGSIDLGWRVLDSVEEVFGMFWANTAKDSNGEKRSKLCQARVIGSFQLTAAILNTGLENGAPVPADLITSMQNALSADNVDEILRLKDLLDTYNNSGTEVDIVDDDGYPVLPADPKCAKALADITIADCNLNG